MRDDMIEVLDLSDDDWKTVLASAEIPIAEYIFVAATAKLRYLLPPDLVVEILDRKKQRTEISQDGVDSGILRDVLLQEFRGRTKTGEVQPLNDKDSLVKAALEKLFLETISWELDEETAVIGTQTLDLFCEALRYLPHAHEKSLECLEDALKDWSAKQSTETKAKVFTKVKKSEAEIDLELTSAWMTDQRRKVEALIDDMKHELKVAESKCNDIIARADVEKEYITDCGQLSADFEYWSMERAEGVAEKKEAYQKAVNYTLPDTYATAKHLYEDLLVDLDRKEEYLAEQDKKTATYLEGELAVAKDSLARVESEIDNCRSRTQVMQEEVLRWRKRTADEMVAKMQLARMWNACIKIQRWFRWIRWKKSRYGKKKKGKGKSRGKKGGKSAGKKGKK